ncbi:formylglycine-generating enzyme family protein [Primorskyibacter sp. S87]|uniref:formylglycine-generating enzyme family protein n=1 Tax=Primorskyibacter sp. S87 TaxID=3415126 RepID=UPI003C7D4786
MRLLAILGILWAGPAAAQDPWPVDLTDPGAEISPSDLVLPMPCGAAMAFQKVEVPPEGEGPLADRRLRLGQSLDQTGYSDYLRSSFLRGAFGQGETSHFYIARYELTQGQYRALGGDCTTPTRADRLAKGGLSWHEAVEVARIYTQWLLANAPDQVPAAGDQRGFLRLPTEPEWEFATRGGARVDGTRFPNLTFFSQGEMRDYAWHQAPGSARGKLGPVGLRQPNPLGLYDVYGNAEELVLEPYRMNALGRLHGQTGGVVTRGGSVLSTADQIYSAQRTEYPPYDRRTGAPLAAATFGLRLVISAPVFTSDAMLRQVQEEWQALATVPAVASGEADDPEAQLAGLIAAETDPRRQSALEALLLDLRRSRDDSRLARSQSARATLLAGGVFVGTINETAERITDKASTLRMLADLHRTGPQSDIFARQVRAHVRQLEALRLAQDTYLLSFRTALDSLAGAPGDKLPTDLLETAYRVLREELDLSGQIGLRDDVARFRNDLVRYAETPDMGPERLLELALD